MRSACDDGECLSARHSQASEELSQGPLCGSGERRGLCMLNGHGEFFLHQSGLFRIHQAEFHYGQLFTTSEQITQPAFSQRDAAKRNSAPGSYCKRCWINSVIEHINLLPVQMPISHQHHGDC
ncbi:uncharacterized [Tachysurus ichikawai]